ncbi:MAG: metal ABC transporter permease [Verrucomicrobia bacterium]|nr:metal ABC transporter permease [Verrucomicrobiota bacterium]
MIEYFTDPVLRAPTWGSMLMCLSASLMGVFVFLRKKSLLSESLSHASYPGVVMGVAIVATFFPQAEEWSFAAVLIGAFIASFLGFQAIEWLEKKGKVRPDAALCFVLSVFFGVGIVAASALQGTNPSWFKQVQMFLFGQAATMTDIHIGIYGSLSAAIALFLFAVYRPLQAVLFDSSYAKSLGIKAVWLERLLFWLLLVSIIVGMRSVGVILMSGMLVAPAVAARQYSNRLPVVFLLAGLFGVLSALIGHVLSVEASIRWSAPGAKFSLPTGPLIVLTGTFWALFSLAFAPKRGVVFRLIRIYIFRYRCLQENILKTLWKKKAVLRSDFDPSLSMDWVLWRMVRHGWLSRSTHYELTIDGARKAASLVRRHRLWELYLTSSLGRDAEEVHRSAEEMEHILTPELEMRLTELLSDPKKDPHQQPIPERHL